MQKAENFFAIVLGAGRSKRFGKTNKLLAPFCGKTVIEKTVEVIESGGFKNLTVVLGRDFSKFERVLGPKKVALVKNPDFARGLSTSVKAGIGALPQEAEWALLVLGDMPFVKPGTVRKLLETARWAKKKVIVPYFEGKRGNPVFFHKDLFPALKNLNGDSGGLALFRENPEIVHKLEVDDPGILTDIDTREDLKSPPD